MSKQPLTPEQVLQDIKAELNQPVNSEPPLLKKINKTRQYQQAFRASPVIGGMASLKKSIYALNNSTFSQQFNINEMLVDLIDDLYHELDHTRTVYNQRFVALQSRLAQASLTPEAQVENLFPSDPTPESTVTPLAPLPTLTRIYNTPAEMTTPERLQVYSLIYGIKPRYCLEIGTFRGGSAFLICGAMDETGFGHLVCVDPNPRIASETWEAIKHRSTLITGPSPDILPEAAKAVSEKFDFALIDGDHSYAGALNDIEGTLPLLADQAYLLFHDSHYFEVKDAIDEALKKYPQQLADCGTLSVHETPQTDGWAVVNGRQVVWGGLRLLRFNRSV